MDIRRRSLIASAFKNNMRVESPPLPVPPITPGGKAAPKKPSRHAIYAVFEDLEEYVEDPQYFTTQGYPKVDIVNDCLEQMGYARLGGRTEVSKWFDDWSKHERREATQRAE